jgi:hypothetical protein
MPSLFPRAMGQHVAHFTQRALFIRASSSFGQVMSTCISPAGPLASATSIQGNSQKVQDVLGESLRSFHRSKVATW